MLPAPPLRHGAYAPYGREVSPPEAAKLLLCICGTCCEKQIKCSLWLVGGRQEPLEAPPARLLLPLPFPHVA